MGLRFEKRYEDVPEEERICPSCGTEMEVIGETLIRRDIDFVPARMRVIEVYSRNYGCPRCRVDSDKAVIRKGIEYLDAFWKWLDSQRPIRRLRLDKAATYIK